MLNSVLEGLTFDDVILLPIYSDVVDAREWNDAEVTSQVSKFIEEKVFPISGP